MIVRPSIGGQRLRVRFSNEFGTAPMTIASAHIALTAEGSRIQAATDRALTFGGSPKITIPAGAPAFSDPVDIAVKPFAEVSISIYLPGPAPASSIHEQALHDAYISGPGDLTSRAELPGAVTKQTWYFLSGIDIWAPAGNAAIVAFGDSITQGYGAKSATYIDYPTQLAQRLAVQGVTTLAIVNQGISGNRILHDVAGANALARFDRDVLSLPGVTHMIVLEGINDITFPHIKLPGPNAGGASDERPFKSQFVSADELIVGLQQIIARAHAHGIKVYGATIMPCEGVNTYTEEGEAVRQAVNRWIRTSHVFDAVIDFDQLMRDPNHPAKMRAEYDSGDHVHPGATGYKAMADYIPLKLLSGRKK
ncbi:MAG: SGNH/GDSL hydrolase family protein [Acidobacteria bacterium]|nr:SGNH/GDSL hydrolase family protein [Acidobacteriota bacterium]